MTYKNEKKHCAEVNSFRLMTRHVTYNAYVNIHSEGQW